MKRSMIMICCVFVTVILVFLPADKSGAASQPDLDKTEVAKLYEMAKKEGEINFVSSTEQTAVAKLFEAFSRKYPGLKLDHIESQSIDAMPRVIAEAKTGRPATDVMRSGSEENIQFEKRDMLAAYDWNRVFGIPEDAILRDGKVLLYYNQAYPIVYNTNLVAPADIPKSLESLLDPKFKGRIGMDLSASHITYLALAMGEKRVKDFAQKLKSQRPIFIKGRSAVADRLVAGEISIALETFLYRVLWYQDKGAPIGWAPVSPIVMSSSYLVVMKKAPHPNASRLWAGWLMSSEGQELLEKLVFLSRLGKGSTSRQWKALQAAKVETWQFPIGEEANKQSERLKKEFQAIFGNR